MMIIGCDLHTALAQSSCLILFDHSGQRVPHSSLVWLEWMFYC